MLLLYGSMHIENGNYISAIQSFEDAQVTLGSRKTRPPLIISLVYAILPHNILKLILISQISGWTFDDLAITIQQRLCESLFVVGRTKEAGESALRMVGGEIDMSESIKTWVSGEPSFYHSTTHLNFATGFMQQCLSAPENDRNASSVTSRNNASHPMRPLLKEWVRLRLTTGSWQDILSSGTGVRIPLS